MNILVVGLGEVGSHLARVLVSEGHAVTVVDADLTRLRRVSEALDVHAIHGDGSRPDILDRAEADSIDLLLAVSNDDNVNMLSCLFGKRIGARRTVLRVKDMTPFQRFRTFFRKNLAFDQILSLESLAATEVVKVVRQNQAVGVENFADGRIQMRRVRLTEDSPLVGVPVRDLKIPNNVLITAIDRHHDVIVPGGDDVCQVGDEVLVLGDEKGIAAFEKKSGSAPTSVRDVVIFGATGIASQVAQSMRKMRIAVRVIVPDRDDAERLAATLDDVTVLHAEGTDLELLREEHVGDCDAFLGLSDVDEVNLMSCQLARTLGVERTIALVHKPDYVSLYEKLGVSVAVSPRLLCANAILSIVRGGSISRIATIEEGKAEVIELEVLPGSKLVGKKLKDARFPRGAVVGAIARESGEIVIPRGDDVIEALDNLVVFALADVLENVLAMVR
ncbi:MAG: Trk system potassium transporter TrkA [Planctomycetota bacterium]